MKAAITAGVLAFAIFLCGVAASMTPAYAKPSPEMPDLRGETLAKSRSMLEKATKQERVRISTHLLTMYSTDVLVEENWIVCVQAPAAKTPIRTGQIFELAIARYLKVHRGCP